MTAIPDLGVAMLSVLIGASVAGLRDDPALADGYVALSVDNSHIELRTKRIDRVVSFGPLALQPLLQEMRRKGATLDTFARCYSSCDQILRKAGLKGSVRWHGGLITTKGEDGRVVGTLRVDGDSAAFRQQQVEEIIRQAKNVGIPLRGIR
jgi:hypothetical protein